MAAATKAGLQALYSYLLVLVSHQRKLDLAFEFHQLASKCLSSTVSDEGQGAINVSSPEFLLSNFCCMLLAQQDMLSFRC